MAPEEHRARIGLESALRARMSSNHKNKRPERGKSNANDVRVGKVDQGSITYGPLHGTLHADRRVFPDCCRLIIGSTLSSARVAPSDIVVKVQQSRL